MTEPTPHHPAGCPTCAAEHWYRVRALDHGVTHIDEHHIDPFYRCNIWHVRGRAHDLLVDSGMGVVSLVGQVLLGRKFIENWLVWLVVNVISVALFAYKGLWLTCLLYGLFALMSVWGWRAWQVRMKASS